MNRVVIVLAVCVAVAAGVAWHFKASLMARVNPPASASQPAESPDVLYSWVDDEGVTHFSAKPAKPGARQLEFDGSRITPVDVVETPVLAPAAVPAESAPSSGNVLKDLRAEMEQNAKRMQEAKGAHHDF